MKSPGIYTKEIDLTDNKTIIVNTIDNTTNSYVNFNQVSKFDLNNQDITTTYAYDIINKRKSLYADNNYCV